MPSTQEPLIELEFPRAVVVNLPAQLARYAREQADAGLRRRLFSAAAKFDGCLATPGDSVRCTAPWSSWHWLAKTSLKFANSGFAARLCEQLEYIESADLRADMQRARIGRDAALSQAARELREREAAGQEV